MSARRLGLLLAAVLALLFVLDRHPLRLPTRGPEVAPGFPARESHHPVLLVVDGGLYEGDAPTDPVDRAPDLEWRNILEQVFGGCDLNTADALEMRPRELLRGRNLVVFPRRTLLSLPPGILNELSPAVEAGLVLLFEGPAGPWCETLGLKELAVEPRPELAWPFARHAGQLEGPLVLPPARPLRLRHTLLRYAPLSIAGRRMAPVHSPTGRPLVWRSDLGHGALLVLGIDLGDLSLRLRQGVPDGGFRLPHRHDDRLPGPGETNDLVATADLLQSDHPWLDAWLAALLDPEIAPAPWPRLWTAPADRDGWLLVTHDDEGFGDRSAWITDAEAEAGVPSTAFFLPPYRQLSPEGLAAMRASGVEVGLHPRVPNEVTWKDPRAPRELFGIWKVQPAGRLPSIAQQRDQLAALSPSADPPRLNRTHYLLWPDDVDEGWRRLVGAGFRADSSYGPDWGAAGWLFGSTMPFRPLSRRGLVHAIWELPFQSAENIGDMSVARLDRWMATNASGSQGPIHLLFHPDAYGWVPSADLFRLWESVPRLAARHAHQPATQGQLLDFWERRAQTQVGWSLRGDRLELRIQAPAGPEPLGLALPVLWRGRSLQGWEASWPGARSRRARSHHGAVRVFTLPEGTGTLQLRYR